MDASPVVKGLLPVLRNRQETNAHPKNRKQHQQYFQLRNRLALRGSARKLYSDATARSWVVGTSIETGAKRVEGPFDICGFVCMPSVYGCRNILGENEVLRKRQAWDEFGGHEGQEDCGRVDRRAVAGHAASRTACWQEKRKKKFYVSFSRSLFSLV